jgi:hypothetical protein
MRRRGWLIQFALAGAAAGSAAGCGKHAVEEQIDEPGIPSALDWKRCASDSGDAIAVSGPEAPAEWRAFRRAHPYHEQQIALGSPRTDGTRILVITEPPPQVCLEDIRQLSPALAQARPYRWRMGLDGWLSDVVAELPAMSSPDLDGLLVGVHRTVFGTSYNARVTPLSAAGTLASNHQLDLSVTATELRQWLLAGPETFSATGTGPGTPLATLLARGAYGEYFSSTPGFVLWLIPLHRDVTPYLPAAGRWVLDADLVLGAIADAGSVAVVGRERQIPWNVLPPLRVETIRMLAGATTNHLAQSYERRFLLAGRFDRRNDWAPIYLSPALIDDEYGSLLNLTDQLLKSWSEHGNVHYVNFGYPLPPRYPFPAALHEVLQSGRVTFNWNTKGAGYVTDAGGFRVYALNRTGALPVSYFAGDDESRTAATEQAEAAAYDYFASLNDPNLARVVQYAALYQLDREFGVTAQLTVKEAPAAQAALVDQVAGALNNLAHIDDEWLARLSSDTLRAQIGGVRWTLAQVRTQTGDSGLRAFAAYLLRDGRDEGNRRADSALADRAFVNDTLRDDVSAEDQLPALFLMRRRVVSSVLRLLAPPSFLFRARNSFIEGANRQPASWIRTASVVQSWSTGSSLEYIGGHNLDAAVTRLRSSPDVVAGEVRVIRESGHDVILANEADIPRLSDNVRSIAEAAEADDGGARLSALVGRLRERPMLPRLAAIPPRPRTPAVRSWGASARMIGYERVPRRLTETERSLATFLQVKDRSFLNVYKLKDGSLEIAVGEPQGVVRATNLASAVDVVVDQTRLPRGTQLPRQLQLSGFSEQDATAFTRNVEWELRRTKRPRPDDIVSVVHEVEGGELRAAQVVTAEADFSRAQVRSIREVEVAFEGRAHRAYQVDLEIPIRAAKQPLHLRIWIYFREGVVRPAAEAIQATISKVMVSLGARATPDVAAAAIKAAIRQTYGEASHVTVHAGDVLIVQRSGGDDATGNHDRA